MKAMDYDLRATAVDDVREASMKFSVRAADFEHATTPASNYPIGQAADLVVVMEDKFGNRVKDWEGSVAVEVPEDPSAEVPAAVAVTDGACRFRGLLLTHAGSTKLVFKSADGATLSQPGEGITVGPAPVRPWLFAGPAPANEMFATDPCASATGDGSVAAKMLLRRRAGGDVVQFSPVNAKRDEAAVLVTWVEALGATKARLLAAAPGRVRVFVDGKSAFDGASKATDGKGKREPVVDLQFAEGTHRLVVVVEAKGATSASFEIDDGAGKFPPTLRIRARSRDVPKTFVVSGRALDRKGAGVAGATITVKGADGRDRMATSAADGTWWIEGLGAGDIFVKVAAGARVFGDADRKATLVDANVVDVDFRETDEAPKPPATK
jgi:hypothetical protein